MTCTVRRLIEFFLKKVGVFFDSHEYPEDQIDAKNLNYFTKMKKMPKLMRAKN